MLVKFQSNLNFLERFLKNTQKSVHWEPNSSMWTETDTHDEAKGHSSQLNENR